MIGASHGVLYESMQHTRNNPRSGVSCFACKYGPAHTKTPLPGGSIDLSRFSWHLGVQDPSDETPNTSLVVSLLSGPNHSLLSMLKTHV